MSSKGSEFAALVNLIGPPTTESEITAVWNLNANSNPLKIVNVVWSTGDHILVKQQCITLAKPDFRNIINENGNTVTIGKTVEHVWYLLCSPVSNSTR
jgi:hypothetical protein